MKKIYACLIGNWVCLNDDPTCKMGIHHASPDMWYEENAPIFAPFNRDAEDTYYQLDYVGACFTTFFVKSYTMRYCMCLYESAL